MKSIKPGRGPSMKGGIMSLAMAAFGVLWIIAVAGMGGGFFALFGVIFVVIALVEAVYSFKNATGENRYSSFDIVDGSEEPDPLNVYYGGDEHSASPEEDSCEGRSVENHPAESLYCPYCGAAVEGDYVYCNKCGRKLP